MCPCTFFKASFRLIGTLTVYQIQPRIFSSSGDAPFQRTSGLDLLISDVSSHKGGLVRGGKLLNKRKSLLKNTEKTPVSLGTKNILEKCS